MRKALHPIDVFKKRRQSLAQDLEGAALILVAHPHYIRNNDVEYPFRQDSNLYYLTGFEEPEAIFVYRPGCKPETLMYVLPKDPTKEAWLGFRFGPEGAKEVFSMDDAHNLDQFEKDLPILLSEVDRVYYTLFTNKEIDAKVLSVIESLTHTKSRANTGNISIEDPRLLIGNMRLIKEDFEIDLMRKAAKISSNAHIEVMKACKPGMNERALHGVFLKSIMEQGCAREAYGSIVAGGNGATCLHYVFNDQPLVDGELLLIDAGGEYQYYAGDITRTYPVNAKFNPTQKRVYEKVLSLQKDLVASVRPQETREGLQKKTIDGLVDIMIEEKLLSGSKAEIIEKKEYMKYYQHGVGHWLGMDVHDAGTIRVNGEPRPLEPGICLTIEPGLYIPATDTSAPEELRGMGIRIEDDVLVTNSGNEVLSGDCPKEVDDLEAIIGKA